ncbi:MAG: TIM barrel protein [Chloroflexota bacterium]
MITFSTSSWTLHGKLGQVFFEHDLHGQSWIEKGAPASDFSLLDFPTFVSNDGIVHIEICHFHFPSIQSEYVSKLKNAINSAGVSLENILVDRGNLASPDDTEREEAIEICKMWFRIAADLGAKGCRIDCGTELPTQDAKNLAADALKILHDYGATLGLALTTENFRRTSQEATDLLEIMKMADRPLGLCLDFGNAVATGDKYGTIQDLIPHTTSLHCKGEYVDGELDREELAQSLSIVMAANYSGLAGLVYGSTENEWAHALELKQAISSLYHQEPV